MPLTAELAYWINERDRIRRARARGQPSPWTEDPVFNTVRFCNVHREHDKVTQWIRENWNRGADPAWKFVLGRMINLPESLEEVLIGWQQHPSEDVLERAAVDLKIERSLGKKIFTSAYTISTCGQRMDKVDYVLSVVRSVQRLGYPDYRSCAATSNFLQQVDGLGSFLAGQVVADMKNTPGHPLATAPDFDTFCVPGPGSLRGLGWWYGEDPECVTRSRFDDVIAACYDAVMPLVDPEVGNIDMQDFQNCLCEFSKYMKLKRDPHAHVRNKYDPFNHSQER